MPLMPLSISYDPFKGQSSSQVPLGPQVHHEWMLTDIADIAHRYGSMGINTATSSKAKLEFPQTRSGFLSYLQTVFVIFNLITGHFPPAEYTYSSLAFNTGQYVLFWLLAESYPIITIINRYISVFVIEKGEVLTATSIKQFSRIKRWQPDIVVCKRQKITCFIDVAITLTTTVTRKYNEKVTRYRDLANMIREIWVQRQALVIPFHFFLAQLENYTLLPLAQCVPLTRSIIILIIIYFTNIRYFSEL